MNSDNSPRSFPNRDFIALTRAELARMGRSDVTIERSWIDEDEPGYQFLLHVPVGTELSIPLKAMNGFFETQTDDDRKRHALEFARALVNLKSAERMLTSTRVTFVVPPTRPSPPHARTVSTSCSTRWVSSRPMPTT